MKTFLTLSLQILLTSFLCAQAPQGIPYQAVMRNADGTVMASSAVSLTFMIHDGSATGTVVYQENHALTSNAQGLVSCVVGNGVVSQGNFSSINWGSGAKFLHVMMGTTDLGTQQMLSVPYALYSQTTNVSISSSGDTLSIGGNSVIVPGISAANPPALYTMGSGVTDIDGNFYPSIVINGQEWMQKNLAVTKYRNGAPITTGLNDFTWQNTTEGAYAIYNDNASNNILYGKLYNWFAVNDSRGLCPIGWHEPSDEEWSLLINYLDPNADGGKLVNIAGDKMKSTTGWNFPNSGANDVSGFSALPSGYRTFNLGECEFLGYFCSWWSNSEIDSDYSWSRGLYYDNSVAASSYDRKQNGFSVRCVRDTDLSIQNGCTDGNACNFIAAATQDDGSCLYQNATCDDGNANTTYDVINASCQCAGTANDTLDIVIGQDYQGGKVAYIFQPEDAGYVAGETHGLIAAAQDLPGTYTWGCYGITISGADGQAIGTGAQNTLDIVNRGCGDAAQACADLVLNGYDDWFLPSLGELEQLYFNRFSIGDFQYQTYWSSTEGFSDYAWFFNFFFGANIYEKQAYNAVRAVRAF